ncbi:MAG: YfhL family 4Fe-4S dicluster ferredoxin [Thiohalorhabdus sp.]|uniref:YfhL family 4Fe-4S dicluster ferredoxin n=1 Tax=Thiohalorhabdus sp. TaxID=3094134 RepID=UPI003980E41A
MALLITEDCINCSVCEPECPNEAIFFDEDLELYQVDPESCTECVGHHDDPQCIEVCPVDCIEPDPDNQESRADLEAKFERLQA